MISLENNDIKKCAEWRNNVVFNPDREDIRDSYVYHLIPRHRDAWKEFRNNGIFLPFGENKNHFNWPNKFILNLQTYAEAQLWCMPDSCDPTDGWSTKKSDEFGDEMKLPDKGIFMSFIFLHKRSPFENDFGARKAACRDRHSLQRLPEIFKKEKLHFDRVDVSNLCDWNYVGIEKILSDWVPLLNHRNDNSALITLFMNWKNNDAPTPFECAKMIRQCGRGRVNEAVKKALMFNSYSFAFSLLDDSVSFTNYLKNKVSMNGEEGFFRRKKHKIVSHRLFAPIDSSDTFTFVKSSKKDFYDAVCFS